MELADAWERHAHDWIQWARAPDHDGFWAGTWPELRRVLPPPGGLFIDLGCGEGRLARELSRLGYSAIGIERSPTLARAAGSSESAVAVALADSVALPLPDAVATSVVACMSLQDLDDLEGTMTEVARVLVGGGSLCVALVHPMASAQDPPSMRTDSFTLTEPYLRHRRYEDHVERDGLAMTFVSMHRPLSAYVESWTRAGLVLTDLREFGDGLVPWLLIVRAAKMSA